MWNENIIQIGCILTCDWQWQTGELKDSAQQYTA